MALLSCSTIHSKLAAGKGRGRGGREQKSGTGGGGGGGGGRGGGGRDQARWRVVKKRDVVLVHQQTRINSNIHNAVIYSLSALLGTLASVTHGSAINALIRLYTDCIPDERFRRHGRLFTRTQAIHRDTGYVRV